MNIVIVIVIVDIIKCNNLFFTFRINDRYDMVRYNDMLFSIYNLVFLYLLLFIYCPIFLNICLKYILYITWCFRIGENRHDRSQLLWVK